ASRDIIIASPEGDLKEIDTSTSNGNGGNVLLVAGAGDSFGGGPTSTASDGSPGPTSATDSQPDSTSSVSIGGPSKTGGEIQLQITQPAGDKGLTAIKTQSLLTNGSGGNVTLIAFWGNNGVQDVNGLTPGVINAPNTVITTFGNGTGTGGNVVIIA